VIDGFGIKGSVHVEAFHHDGMKYYDHVNHNTITAIQDEVIAALVCGQSTTTMEYGHAGTGTGQGAASTNLATACGEARTAITSGTQGTAGDDNDVVVVYTLAAGVCTATITEIGLFKTSNQVTGDMLCYDDTLTVTKAAGDSLTVTWTLTYGAS